MDSPNPYSHRSNFMDLLNSQQDSHFPQHIPYTSFSQTVPAGSSAVPHFSSQCSEDPKLDEDLAEDRKERKRWKPVEDIVLISAWLNTSKDPVVSNEQRSGAFWTRIAALYADSPSISDAKKREPNTCKQRWRKINDQVSKFCGAYAAAKSQYKSGMNDLDDLKLAHQIFFNDYKVKFTLEYAWNELKNEQKWCALSTTKAKGKGEVSSAHSVSSQSVNNVEDDIMVRSPGVKASKAKRKRIVTKTSAVEEQTTKLENFQSMWEIKQKDLVLKDQILNKKMLDNLLAKPEPLSGMETTLKEKLIAHMLSKF